MSHFCSCKKYKLHFAFFAIILEGSLIEKLTLTVPEQTIKFKVYKRDHVAPEIKTDKRLGRVRNQNKLPLGVWATWISESILFVKMKEIITINHQAHIMKRMISGNKNTVFLRAVNFADFTNLRNLQPSKILCYTVHVFPLPCEFFVNYNVFLDFYNLRPNLSNISLCSYHHQFYNNQHSRR